MLLNCPLDGLYHLRVTFDKVDTYHLTRASPMQGCHKGRFWRKITVRTSFSFGRRPDVRVCPHLTRGRGLTCGRVFTVRRRGKNRVRTEAGPRPRRREK
jgi:hypothetical protein